MIREAGRDFWEVIPGQQNFLWKNGKNIYQVPLKSTKKTKSLKQTSDNIHNCCKSLITFI